MAGGHNCCICHTCGRTFYSLGIARHRKAHRDRGEGCKITYSTGVTKTYKAPREEDMNHE